MLVTIFFFPDVASKGTDACPRNFRLLKANMPNLSSLWGQNSSCTVSWLQWPQPSIWSNKVIACWSREGRRPSLTCVLEYQISFFHHKVPVELQTPNLSTSTLPMMGAPCHHHAKLQLRTDVSSSGKDRRGDMVWTNTLQSTALYLNSLQAHKQSHTAYTIGSYLYIRTSQSNRCTQETGFRKKIPHS